MKIDPRYLEVCEPGSVCVCGCAANLPVLVGAEVIGDSVRIATGGEQFPVRVNVRLTGIRLGFKGLRFLDKTQADFDANEAFLKGALPNG